MPKNLSYTLLGEWFGAGPGLKHPPLDLLKPHELLLLLSDGSLTVELELLTRGRVEVEFLCRARAALDAASARYLGEEPGSEALEREVWLETGGRKLVYAHAIIPVRGMDEGLRAEIEHESADPLGRVLARRRVFFSKERLEVGVVRCAAAARGLDMDADAPLVARRYLLIGGHGPERATIRASVTEVFSPKTIPCPAIQG